MLQNPYPVLGVASTTTHTGVWEIPHPPGTLPNGIGYKPPQYYPSTGPDGLPRPTMLPGGGLTPHLPLHSFPGDRWGWSDTTRTSTPTTGPMPMMSWGPGSMDPQPYTHAPRDNVPQHHHRAANGQDGSPTIPGAHTPVTNTVKHGTPRESSSAPGSSEKRPRVDSSSSNCDGFTADVHPDPAKRPAMFSLTTDHVRVVQPQPTPSQQWNPKAEGRFHFSMTPGVHNPSHGGHSGTSAT